MTSETRELLTYRRRLAELRDREGKFAVISGDDIVGCYDTYADAIEVAYEKCPLEAFLVKRIEAVERVFTFTRGIVLA